MNEHEVKYLLVTNKIAKTISLAPIQTQQAPAYERVTQHIYMRNILSTDQHLAENIWLLIKQRLHYSNSSDDIGAFTSRSI